MLLPETCLWLLATARYSNRTTQFINLRKGIVKDEVPTYFLWLLLSTLLEANTIPNYTPHIIPITV